MMNTASEEKYLCIDIGGSRIKAILLDPDGKMLIEYQRLNTPAPATPDRVIQTIAELTKSFEGYTKVSVGFPGYVRKGIVITAPNLGTENWRNVDLGKRLTELLRHPVRIVNDADLQGL